jgi:hypothetical protein
VANVTVSKHLKVLGTGTLASGATSIAAWSPTGALTRMVGCNVWVTITSSTHIGQGFRMCNVLPCRERGTRSSVIWDEGCQDQKSCLLLNYATSTPHKPNLH